jgi:hypothetical protein
VYGFRTPEQGKLFESMVNKHSNHYLQWSLKSVARWKDVGDISSELIRFHGERDFTFPLRKVKQPFSLLEGASHFMIITESERLNPLIREALKY